MIFILSLQSKSHVELSFKTMETKNNRELQSAWDFVENTGRSIFLTGKAGTGKTTFLKRVVETSRKRIIVVAPTGVAAINAGGVTIHSFFLCPKCEDKKQIRLWQGKAAHHCITRLAHYR